MRTRLFVISSLALASVLGTASAAVAGPPTCCGDLKQGGTTPTTQAPKGPDKFAPKPTTTIPPKGPGDLAPKPPQGDDPGPQGPDDIAQPQGGQTDPKPPVDKPSGGDDSSQGTGQSGNDDGNGAGTEVQGETVSHESTDDAAAEATVAQKSAGVSPFVLIFLAAVVGGLLALLATRMRRDEEDVEQV